MATVRRLYLYLVALASILISMAGLWRLAQGLLAGRLERELVAFNVALLVISLPVYAFHWLLAERAIGSGKDDRHVAARKFYLYAALLVALAIGGYSLFELLERLLLAALGATVWPERATLGEPLAAIIITSLFWLYHRYLVARDRAAAGIETDPGAVWGRLYLYIVSAAGLAIFFFGLTDLLIGLLHQAIPVPAESRQYLDLLLATDGTRLLVGSVAWIGHWLVAQRRFLLNAQERRSTVRKSYLYLAVLVSAVLALTSVTLLIRDALNLLLGASGPGASVLLDRVAGPVSLAFVGTIFWLYHWRVLQWDMSQTREAPRQASIRRLYFYLVSGAGLALVAWGLAHLLGALIAAGAYQAQQVVGRQLIYQFGADWLREQVSLNVALLVVGVPVWVRHWRIMDAQAAEAESQAGAEERGALLRRIYLYLVLFASAVVLLIQPARFLFELLNVLLGAPMPRDFWDQIGGEVSNSAVAGIMWLYHWFILRRDQRLREELVVSSLADESASLVLVIDTEAGELGCDVVRQLRRAAPGVRVVAWGSGERARATLTECTGTEAGDLRDLLPVAAVVVAPLTALLPDATGSVAELAVALAATAGPRVVIPTTPAEMEVAGLRSRSPHDLARAAVHLVLRHLAQRAGATSP